MERFVDARLIGNCSYCGAVADSRDHVPSRVLLDEPYPKNLQIAESCAKCNGGFSIDEEYLACLIECVIQGTTTPNNKFRIKVLRTLTGKPSIAARIESGKAFDQNNTIWQPDWDSVKNIILKLARGHMSYELGIQHIDEPVIVDIVPMPCMTNDELIEFNSFDDGEVILWPEIGSRAFVNASYGRQTAYGQWLVVQDGRYRYAIGQSSGDWVKFVLSEYLACRVVWE